MRTPTLPALLVAFALAGCATTPAAPPTTRTPAPTGTSVPTGTSAPTASATGPTAPAASGSPASPNPSWTPAPTPVSPTTAATTASAGCPATTGSPLRSAPGSGKTVALTFDDGPGPQTLAIADALAAEGVHATFFATGQHAQAQPDVVRELARRGHLVEGHSFDHRYPKAVSGGWTTAFVADQVTRTAAVLRQQTGQTPCFFRPPGGFLDQVSTAARHTGVTVVLWSVDSLDWQQPGATTAAATATIVANATKPGEQRHPIVLFHDAKASAEPDTRVSPNRSNTVAALPAVIDYYKASGFRFVRLDGRS